MTSIMPTLRIARNRPEPVTAFVLSGGASLGAIQAGMLRALYEHQILPDMIVATSAGALNAGFIATRPGATETIDELYEVWSSLRREHVFPISHAAGLGAQRISRATDRFHPFPGALGWRLSGGKPNAPG